MLRARPKTAQAAWQRAPAQATAAQATPPTAQQPQATHSDSDTEETREYAPPSRADYTSLWAATLHSALNEPSAWATQKGGKKKKNKKKIVF